MDVREVEMMLEEESKKGNWIPVLIRYYPEKMDKVREHMTEICSLYPHIKDSFLIKCFMNGIRTTDDVPVCEYCGAKRCSLMKMGNKFNTTCSKECRNAKKLESTKKTNLKNYGVEHAFSREEVRDKIENTMYSRYGVSNPQQFEEIRNRTVETLKSRYGVSNPSQSKELRKKAIDTLKNNYGVCTPAKSEEIRLKTLKTNQDRYGGNAPQCSPEIRQKIDNTNMMRYGGRAPASSEDVILKQKHTTSVLYGRGNFKQLHYTEESFDILTSSEKLLSLYDEVGDTLEVANILGCDRSTINDYLNKYGSPAKRKTISHGENKVAEFIESLGFTIIRSDRTILAPYESDIVIPEKNLIIEFNGTYWHSEEHKPKKYHQTKSLMAHEKNYQLIHIWEDDWVNDHKRQIIKNKIKSKLGVSTDKVFARKTTVKEPTKAEVRELMFNNHIQGFVGYTLAYGLYENDKLVACLTLRKTKTPGVYDLNRYATSKTVVGGMSKLLSHVKKNLDFEEIYTYAHLDYSSGDVYEKSGFTKNHITPPGLWYFERGHGVRLRRERFMKHKLPVLFGEVDLSKTESEIMHENGYLRLFDAGSIKYSLTK